MLTVGGALRAKALDHLTAVGKGLGERWWRDNAPAGATLPYVTFLDPMSQTVVLAGDQKALARSTLIQLDLWQKYKDEDDALLIALQAAVDGVRISPSDPDGPIAAFTTRLRSTARIPDPDRNLVHHALTVAVAHRSST